MSQERKQEYYRQHYQANRERIIARMKEYNATHPEVLKRAGRKYRAKNRLALNAKRRKGYAANPGKDYASHKIWVAKNKSDRAAYMRQWRADQQEHRKKYADAYRRGHLVQMAEKQNARRARQIGNGGTHTKEQWAVLKEAYQHRCGYCGTGNVRITKDHATPLARGGRDDIENIIPACLPCNRRKQVKTAEEFMKLLVKTACPSPKE
jgi:hypothetical protein